MERSPLRRIAHADRAVAARALARWGPDAELRAHLGNSASSVFAANVAGRRCVLRLTDARFRSQRATSAEVHFTEFLGGEGIPVSRAVRAQDGGWTETVKHGESTFVAAVSSWAPGIVVDASSPRFDCDFTRAWGASLAQLHDASERYAPADPGARLSWTGEVWLAGARELLADDAPAWGEYERIVDVVAGLARTRQSFGMLHNDHGPQNFRFDPAGGITHFDFGNACEGWYLMDAMPPLGYLRRADGGHGGPLTHAFLAGYRSVRDVADDAWALRAELLRFRRFYVYLSRLWAFGPDPEPPQRDVLVELHTAALAAVAWL